MSLPFFATLFGLATSLGIGAGQANAGLSFLFGLPSNNLTMVLLIAAITGVALVSVLAGLDAGVKRLSEINMVLAGVLLLFVILVDLPFNPERLFRQSVGLWHQLTRPLQSVWPDGR